MFFCVACYENFAVNQKVSIFASYVVKEFAHAFSCGYIELWMHLGRLESTEEATELLSAEFVILRSAQGNFKQLHEVYK